MSSFRHCRLVSESWRSDASSVATVCGVGCWLHGVKGLASLGSLSGAPAYSGASKTYRRDVGRLLCLVSWAPGVRLVPWLAARAVRTWLCGALFLRCPRIWRLFLCVLRLLEEHRVLDSWEMAQSAETHGIYFFTISWSSRSTLGLAYSGYLLRRLLVWKNFAHCLRSGGLASCGVARSFLRFYAEVEKCAQSMLQLAVPGLRSSHLDIWTSLRRAHVHGDAEDGRLSAVLRTFWGTPSVGVPG